MFPTETKNVTKSQISKIEEILSELNQDEVHARTDYVPRGHQASECIGFVGEDSLTPLVPYAIARILSAQDEAGYVIESVTMDEWFMDISSMMRQDAMGRDTIFYFPGLVLVEDDK